MRVYISSLPSQCSCVCFIAGSLIKAMQYGGNLDSENPVFFESISSAIDAIQIHRVRLTSRSRWSLEGFLDAHSDWLKSESLIHPVNLLCRNLLSVCNLQLVLSLRNAVFHFLLLAVSSHHHISFCNNVSIFYDRSRGAVLCCFNLGSFSTGKIYII